MRGVCAPRSLAGLMSTHGYLRSRHLCRMPLNGSERLTPCLPGCQIEIALYIHTYTLTSCCVQAFGIDLGVKMCKRLLDEGTPGLHMYTLNLEQAAVGILEALGLINKKQVSTACCAAATHSCSHAKAASTSVVGVFSGLLLLERRLLWAEHDHHRRESCWQRGYAGIRHQSLEFYKFLQDLLFT